MHDFEEKVEELLLCKNLREKGLKLLDLKRTRNGPVLVCDSNSGRVAIKLSDTTKTDDRSINRTASLKKEAKALKILNFHSIGDSVQFGEDCDFVWLLNPWIDGKPMHKAFDEMPSHRTLDILKNKILSYSIALHEIHQKGWLHGDIQPSHMLDTKDGIVVIDYGCARPIGLETDYKGAMVHYVSPRIAKSMKSKNNHILNDKSDDIFGLIASLYYSLHGKVLYDYGAPLPDVPFEEKLTIITEGDHQDHFYNVSTGFKNLDDFLFDYSLGLNHESFDWDGYFNALENV